MVAPVSEVLPLPSLFDLYHRGELLAQLPPEMPEKISEQIFHHLQSVINDAGVGNTVSIEMDIIGLLKAPGVRAYVFADWEKSGPTRWAAVASFYLKLVKARAPEVLARYVEELVPCVAATISSVVQLFRLGPGNELSVALRNRNDRQTRLSLLGPLAMFFIESVARGRLAWNTLVDLRNAPETSRTFGWAPTLDPLPLVIRLTLLGFTSRFPRPKALLYSPLARYLIELGILHRLRFNPKIPAPADDKRWLLSCDFSRRARRNACGAIAMDTKATSPRSWEASEAAIDLRTQRGTPTPSELIELAESRERLLAAARSLVHRYAGARRPQLKRLILWAHVAQVDASTLVNASPSLNEEELAALAGAAMQKKWRGELEKLNAKLRDVAAVIPCMQSGSFTSGQSRTTLTRLRKEFRDELNMN